MDIFTTQLTRVVAVPIKPTTLKVKALLKEAASSKLSQDSDHLENHEYYFSNEEDQYHGSEQEDKQESKQYVKQDTDLARGKNSEESTEGNNDNSDHNIKGGTKHLDLYA